MKISEVARASGINRGTITRLYHEQAVRVELEVIDALCALFQCQVGDIFEYVPEGQNSEGKEEEPSGGL